MSKDENEHKTTMFTESPSLGLEPLAVLTLVLSVVLTPTLAVTQIKIGVMLINDTSVPYSIQRTGPAIDIAIATVNTEILNGSYQLVPVVRIYDSICDPRYASGVASELHYKEGVQALIGPACSNALDHVARLAGYWNMPILTGLGDSGIFNNKTVYPTLTRFAYCQCRIRNVFAGTFKMFNWTNIALIYDHSDIHADILGTTLKDGLPTNKYFPDVVAFYSSSADYNPRNLLTTAAKHSRIIMLIVSGDHLRDFMIAAYHMGYATSGDFVFMNVELFPFPGGYWGNNNWARNDSNDRIARVAFESLLRVALYLPFSIAWHNFTVKCRELSLQKYNFSYGSEEVNYFVGAFHDAIIRFGLALNTTLTLGDDLSNGRVVSKRMWNYTTYDVTGDVIIDVKGDRNSSFSVKDMDPVTGEFQIVGYYYGDRPTGLTLVPNRTINWGGGRLKSPPNVPYCGFDNENSACQPPDSLPTYMIAIITLFGVVIISLVVGFFVYRRIVWERDLTSTAWRVNYGDIKLRQTFAQSTKFSIYSMKTKDSDMQSVQSGGRQNFTLIGNFKGEMVAIKKVRVQKIEVNRSVLLELKMVRAMRHENLTGFVGACVEPGNVCLIYEYCKKGSLQDVLLTDSLKLDWTFKVSLLRDVAKGMLYIHQSEIGCHGRLTSANCVVDGKFNVKVTDFGLPTFRLLDDIDLDKDSSRHSELQKLMWVAPEHISRLKRVGGSKKGDVYSFAIIMEETLTRSVPYDCQRDLMEVDEIIRRVCSDTNPPFRPEVQDVSVQDSYIALMEKCWSQVPELRPPFDTVLKVINTFSGGKDVALVDRLLARLEEYTSNLEELVEERTQQLALEKKKSELLLDEILPRSVSEKLKQGQPIDPETYDMVTIYFSDIVGFTSLSAGSSPLEVVVLLNALYSEFDGAIENFDVYKVETIGDAYMVVSGLPLRNGDDHVLNIARLALELLKVVARFVVPHKPEHRLQLRIGLHSGPVVAGVVGMKMPRYCLFGDTVNTASRMESNGEAQKVHISESSKQLLDKVGHFETELRGEVAMKGKGTQVTYWLLRELDAKSSQTLSSKDTDRLGNNTRGTAATEHTSNMDDGNQLAKQSVIGKTNGWVFDTEQSHQILPSSRDLSPNTTLVPNLQPNQIQEAAILKTSLKPAEASPRTQVVKESGVKQFNPTAKVYPENNT